MWSTGIYVAELAGTLFLTMMALFTILAAPSAMLRLKLGAKKVFSAVMIGLSLALAIYISQAIATTWKGTKVTGYVNPAVALLVAIKTNNYDPLLPALAGEISGGLVGAALVMQVFLKKFGQYEQGKIDFKAAFGMANVKTPFMTTVTGELVGSCVFLGSIIATILVANDLAPIMIGVAIMIVMLTFGLRFVLILNAAAAILPMLLGLFVKFNRPENKWSAVQNVTWGLITNLATGAALGALYYGFAHA